MWGKTVPKERTFGARSITTQSSMGHVTVTHPIREHWKPPLQRLWNSLPSELKASRRTMRA